MAVDLVTKTEFATRRGSCSRGNRPGIACLVVLDARLRGSLYSPVPKALQMSHLHPEKLFVDGTGRRFAVVAARFNAEVVDRLLEGALAQLAAHGVARNDIDVVRVPGAWEIPQALDLLARSGRYEALIALGAVIRGETPHFDFVAAECSRGVAEAARTHRRPIAFGVLTCDTLTQALDRAGGAAGNKGEEAASAALEMAELYARGAG